MKKNTRAKMKKYTEKDKRDDLERLALLLINLEAPQEYKQVYEERIINVDEFGNEERIIEEKKDNLIWLNHNLTILNKRNIKLIETLKLIQRILRKI